MAEYSIVDNDISAFNSRFHNTARKDGIILNSQSIDLIRQVIVDYSTGFSTGNLTVTNINNKSFDTDVISKLASLGISLTSLEKSLKSNDTTLETIASTLTSQDTVIGGIKKDYETVSSAITSQNTVIDGIKSDYTTLNTESGKVTKKLESYFGWSF